MLVPTSFFRLTTRVVFMYKVLKGYSSFSRSPVKIGSTRFYCAQFLYILHKYVWVITMWYCGKRIHGNYDECILWEFNNESVR